LPAKPQKLEGAVRPWSPSGPPTFLLGLALVAGLVVFLRTVNEHYLIKNWLVWHYLQAIVLALAWGVSCLSFGFFLLDRVRAQREAVFRDAVLAFPLGVFAFQLAIFMLGLAHLLGSLTFALLPLAFAAAGMHRLVEAGRALRQVKTPRTFVDLALLLFGLAGLGLLYFEILSPEAIHWDARWYHLPIARQYALWGAIRPFPEGWWLGAYPHSASLSYTWAFLAPRPLLFDRLELCLHMEFLVFVATLASTAALARALAPAVSGRGAWVVTFLFPGIFLYDSNLVGAADHFAALLCIPLALSLITVWSSFTPRNALLFAIFMAAGINTKLSAWCMLLLPTLLFVLRALWLILARALRRPGAPPRPVATTLFVLGAVLLLTTPFWAKNWLWYGDPLYPRFHGRLPLHPWNPEALASLDVFNSFNFTPRPGLDGVLDALKATVTFSFIPNDWPAYHRDVPVFGSLFTLTLLCLFFVRPRARAAHWLTYAGAMVAIVAWYMLSHQDRYLQVWLPAMAAATAAALGLVWKSRNRLIQGLTALLIAAQVLWGGDIPFFPTHNLVHDSQLRMVISFLSSGFMRTPNRFRLYGDESLVDAVLPRDANALLHELNPQLGIDVLTVNDQWQGLLSYGTLGSPAAIHRAFADLKITHLVWNPTQLSPWNSIASGLAFINYAANFTVEQIPAGQYRVARFVADRAPPAAFNDLVAVMSCGSYYPEGRYRLKELRNLDPGIPTGVAEAPLGDEAAAVTAAGFLVIDPACHPTLPTEVASAFQPPTSWNNRLQLYVRRTPGDAPAP
jgi:hypothetical protein